MVFKNTEVARFIATIDKTSPSIFMLPHPLQGTRSMCSIGSSTNSCVPLFDIVFGPPSPRACHDAAGNQTRRTRLLQDAQLVCASCPSNGASAGALRHDLALCPVFPQRLHFRVCLCSTAERTLLTLGRPLPRLTSGCSVLSFSFSVPSEFISWFSFPSLLSSSPP